MAKYKEPNWTRWWYFAFVKGFLIVGLFWVGLESPGIESNAGGIIFVLVVLTVLFGPYIYFMVLVQRHYDELGFYAKSMLVKNRNRHETYWAPENGTYAFWMVMGGALGGFLLSL